MGKSNVAPGDIADVSISLAKLVWATAQVVRKSRFLHFRAGMNHTNNSFRFHLFQSDIEAATHTDELWAEGGSIAA